MLFRNYHLSNVFPSTCSKHVQLKLFKVHCTCSNEGKSDIDNIRKHKIVFKIIRKFKLNNLKMSLCNVKKKVSRIMTLNN